MPGSLKTNGRRAPGPADGRDGTCRLTLSRLTAALFWFPVAYFAVQVVSRFLVSPTLEMDEAEQVLLAQDFAWGYGAQPPLYTWLQILVFELTGEGALGLALLKNSLLVVTFLATWRIVRLAGGDRIAAALAAVSLFLIPQLAWEAQRDLTHSVLVLATTMLAVLAFVRLCRRGRALDHALFGTVVAAGALSKYNFLLLPAAMIVAACSIDDFRSRVLDVRLSIPLAVVLGLIALPATWMIEHPAAALAGTREFAMGDGGAPLATYATGLFKLLQMSGAVLGPLALVWGLAVVRARPARPPAPEAEACARLLARSLLLGLLVCAVLIVLFEVTRVKDRWLLPLFCVAPVVLALWLRPRLNDAGTRLILGAGMAAALIVLLLLPARTLLGPRLGLPNRLNFPAAAFARDIEARGFRTGVILSDDAFIAGNLRLTFPGASAVVAGHPWPAGADLDGCWLLAWDPGSSATVPAGLAEAYESAVGARLDRSAAAVLRAPLVHAPAGGMTGELGVLIADGGACAAPG